MLVDLSRRAALERASRGGSATARLRQANRRRRAWKARSTASARVLRSTQQHRTSTVQRRRPAIRRPDGLGSKHRLGRDAQAFSLKGTCLAISRARSTQHRWATSCREYRGARSGAQLGSLRRLLAEKQSSRSRLRRPADVWFHWCRSARRDTARGFDHVGGEYRTPIDCRPRSQRNRPTAGLPVVATTRNRLRSVRRRRKLGLPERSKPHAR